MINGIADWLLAPTGLTPHGFCLLWEPGLIWLYALSDVGIAIAYFTIPLGLVVFARRRKDFVFRPVLWLFAAFILLCGATHVLDVVTLWVPAYGLEGVAKAATAVVSLVTAVAVWRLMPLALNLPSPRQMHAADVALRQSEARFRASFERSPVPLYVLDGAERLVSVSDSWLDLFGYTRAEVVGRPVADFRAPLVGSAIIADRARFAAQGEIRDVERSYLRRDGTVVEALVSARLDSIAGGPVSICVLTDVTARRRAEAALRESEARLHQSQKMEAVGQLTGGFAHDINNRLQSISGSLQLMQRRVAQGRPEEVGRHVAAASQAVDRAAGLTHRLLAFSRRQTLQPTAVEPDRLVRGMEDLIRRTLGPQVRLEHEPHDDVWTICCDENQLESAVLNLVINARDAMPDGGTLRISTTAVTLTPADLLAHDDGAPGDYVAIEIADSGTGMAPDVMTHVFEPFFTTKPVGQGTGLGLSQIYGFVRQSGGMVRLESQPGVGTAIRLYFPRHDEAATAAPDSRPTGAPELPGFEAGGRTILIVEDEESVRAQIVEALRDHGCMIVQASDGPAGLRVIQSSLHLDLLLTDIGMPGLNGRQLADAARTSRPELPVILITGYAGAALDVALPPGMEIVRKPFTLDELSARVAAALDRPVASVAASP